MIEKIYKIYQDNPTICIDSRRVTKNSIFIALKGENFDGNLYAKDAISKGSKIAIVSDKEIANDDNILFVEDCLIFLQDLAKFHRDKLGIPIIAITGSNGKTTTKELLATVLSKKFRIGYTHGNMNNHIGVPLTLLSMNKTIDLGIVEMGANHIGEIKVLCEIAKPNFGIITNIGFAHIEGFGSLEGVRQAKGELYDYIKKNKGIIFFNGDNNTLRSLTNNYKKTVEFGKNPEYYCSGTLSSKSYYAEIKWSCKKETGFAKSNLIGEYNYENILAAICIGNYFDLPSPAIDKAISSYFPGNNRSQMLEGTRNRIILDLYNANPTSMLAALNNFISLKDNNKCLILGDMLELGNISEKAHKELLDFLTKQNFKDVYLIGEIFYKYRNEYKFNFYTHVESLNKHLLKKPTAGNFYLVKGSRGIKLEKCIDYL